MRRTVFQTVRSTSYFKPNKQKLHADFAEVVAMPFEWFGAHSPIFGEIGRQFADPGDESDPNVNRDSDLPLRTPSDYHPAPLPGNGRRNSVILER
jgi:hypothetical protein